MRQLLAITVIVGSFTANSHASTIQGKLGGFFDATNPLLLHVEIQVRSDAVANPNALGDGGVAVVQFDVISMGTGNIVPVNYPTPPPPNAGKVVTTFNSSVSTYGGQGAPRKRNATAFDKPVGFNGPANLYRDDGDLDAMVGLLADTSLNYLRPQVGVGQFVTIATEDWLLNSASSTDTLALVLSGSSYYDFSAAANATSNITAYTDQGTVAQITIPEPATIALMAPEASSLIIWSTLGALALFAKKRAAAKLNP